MKNLMLFLSFFQLLTSSILFAQAQDPDMLLPEAKYQEMSRNFYRFRYAYLSTLSPADLRGFLITRAQNQPDPVKDYEEMKSKLSDHIQKMALRSFAQKDSIMKNNTGDTYESKIEEFILTKENLEKRGFMIDRKTVKILDLFAGHDVYFVTLVKKTSPDISPWVDEMIIFKKTMDTLLARNTATIKENFQFIESEKTKN